MSHSPARPLLSLARTGIFWLVNLGSIPAIGAELTLLTIEGDLIGKIESLEKVDDAALIISSYYELLPEELIAELEIHRQQLADLIPDYEVSFKASDSAELMNVQDDIDVHWNAVRAIHGQHFTGEVVKILEKAYDDVYVFIGS